MSPSLPSSGVATAEVSRNPVKTQVTQVLVVSRSRWIVGSAGTTSVCWRTYDTAAIERIARVRPGRRAA